MPDRDININELSRYVKASPRLVLEEHSHCEVPAGCGGVVLRWRDPAEGLPVELWLLTAGEADGYLDGRKAPNGRPILSYGPHVLATRITGAEVTNHQEFQEKTSRIPGILMFAATCETTVDPSKPASSRILSAADGTWKYVLTELPGDQWTQPEFDDTGWPSMREEPVAEPGE